MNSAEPITISNVIESDTITLDEDWTGLNIEIINDVQDPLENPLGDAPRSIRLIDDREWSELEFKTPTSNDEWGNMFNLTHQIKVSEGISSPPGLNKRFKKSDLGDREALAILKMTQKESFNLDGFSKDLYKCVCCGVKQDAGDDNGCQGCGKQKDSTEFTEESNGFCRSTNLNHNTSSSAFMPFRFVGTGAGKYQKSLLKTSSDYTVYRKNINTKEFYRYNNQFNGRKVPKSALNLAIEKFTTIKKSGKIFRNFGKRGVMGACLTYACIELGITKPPRDIAAIMDIEEKFLSQGDRIVREMHENGVLNIITKTRPIEDHIKQYFCALEIDEKYKCFVSDLIQRAEDKKLHIMNDSRPTTKCAGAIFMLTVRLKLNITQDQIADECSISKTTFKRYYRMLYLHHNKLRKIFIKHKIPMPKEWRPTA